MSAAQTDPTSLARTGEDFVRGQLEIRWRFGCSDVVA